LATVSYHDTVNVLQGLEGLEPSGPFDRPEWFALLAEAGQAPLVASMPSARMVLTRANDRLEPLRNWYTFTWRAQGDVRELAEIARDLRAQTHRVTLWPVPDEDGSATRLADAFRAGGWRVSVEPCDHNHVLNVQGRSFAEYWAGRPGPMRTTLKRKAKKVAVEIHDAYDPAVWAEYEEIYAESWKPGEGDPALLRAFARAEAAAGRMRLGIARAEGTAVAAQFWTVEQGVAYIHKLAHRESAKPLSAGTTLSAALFAHAIDRDHVSLIDFGTGDDAYKRDWMEDDRPRYRIDCLDPGSISAWPALLKRALRALAPGSGAR
jgi:hypothetical protein